MNQTIEIPVTPTLTPGQQIESALAALAPHQCERHPNVTLKLDHEATLKSCLDDSWQDDERLPWDRVEVGRTRYKFRLVLQRCPECPFSIGGQPVDRSWMSGEAPCQAMRGFSPDIAVSKDHPVPVLEAWVPLILDQTAEQQFQSWLARIKQLSCGYGQEPVPLVRLRSELAHRPAKYRLRLSYPPCPQCWLERKGILPNEAFASFANFIAEPPAIRAHLETCQHFADNPGGALLMIGSTGNGKTHLAIAIMRERFRRGFSDVIFIKQRHFLDHHWQDKRPLPFGDEKPEGILEKCQQTELLIFDELREATSSRDIEDPLLDLFEYRIGHHLPTVITANVKRAELETAIGSRLLDRLSQANFALAEFNFPSRRASLNVDYLAHCAPQIKPTP